MQEKVEDNVLCKTFRAPPKTVLNYKFNENAFIFTSSINLTESPHFPHPTSSGKLNWKHQNVLCFNK